MPEFAMKNQRCNCRSSWDMRCVCDPNYNNKNWKSCPYRYDNALWFIQNDEWSEKLMIDVMKGHLSKEAAAEVIAKKYNLKRRGAKKVVNRCIADITDNYELYDKLRANAT